MIVFLNGKFLQLSEVKISPFDRGFLFADGVYEVIRTYNSKLFCLNEHLNRLKYSLTELKIKYPNIEDFEMIAYKLAKINKILPKDFSVYIQITRGVQFPRDHYYNELITPTVFIYVSEIKDNSIQINKGIKVILEEDTRWNRCDIKSISILPAILANTKALKSNAHEAIFFRNNLITEGSHSNFFGVKNNIVYTAPLSNYLLNGITRQVVFGLCKKNKIEIVEDYIPIDQLNYFDEFFITGTISEITPVIQINNLIIGNGLIGNLTKKIQNLFYDYVNTLK